MRGGDNAGIDALALWPGLILPERDAVSEKVKRFFEQRRLAAEGTWTPSAPKPEAEQGVTTTFYFAESIGLPARIEVPNSSKTPQRIERFFRRRQEAEEGIWSPLPSMTLSTSVRAPRLLAPVPRHGAPLLTQDEPEIAWNRPKTFQQSWSFSEFTPREQECTCLAIRVVAVALMIIGSILLICGAAYGPPLTWGGILSFACSFVRERHGPPVPSPKKPPQAAPFQLAWETTRTVEQPELEQLALERLALEELDLCEAGSSHHESA